MVQSDRYNRVKGQLQRLPLVVLGIIWLVGAVGDRIWFTLDREVPAWDQADYLTGSLNYWQALQNPDWFSSEWWTHFWQLSSKIPPLTYIAAAIVQNIFGRGADRATLINLFFSAILLISVYGLGKKLFDRRVGLWAAGLCQILPALYRYRLDFLLDYPLTAAVSFSFYCLTLWKLNSEAENHQKCFQSWLWAAAFGLSFGLALMVKQTALMFLLIPILWVEGGIIRNRAWGKLAQIWGALCLSLLVCGPWYRINWLLILTSGKRATIDSAIAEGDPALNTLDAWIYYLKILPYLVSWPLLLVPIVGILLYAWKRSANFKWKFSNSIQNSLRWIVIFLIGSYLLCSLNINKDPRYVLPYLPEVSLLLAYGLTLWTGRWAKQIRWGTVSLAILLMFLNLWPVGGEWLTQILSPRIQHYAYSGTQWPHQKVIDEIIKTAPYLRSTLGVLPSTPEINQHNFNYYGALANFQVYGRQVGTRKKHVLQDARSLSWFLTKTDNQGSVPTEAQSAIAQRVEEGSHFQLQKAWNLPDRSILKLYHLRQPPVEVTKQGIGTQGQRIQLNQINVPKSSPPGVPIPVTYEWFGAWESLQSGLVLLTWQNVCSKDFSPNCQVEELKLNANKISEAEPRKLRSQAETGNESGGSAKEWLHDHGIGMGNLKTTEKNLSQSPITHYLLPKFRVVERTAMLPPANIIPGIYTVEATYLNRKTGETYPIPVPPVSLTIDPAARAIPAPELDLVTQLRSLSTQLPKGAKALDRIFDETGRINQYDPIQDYLNQASLTLEYRLQQEPQNLEWAYALALTKVLQRQVKGAIAALERVIQLDSQNPYAYAYLAFVNLYDWRPGAAQAALKPALALNPNLPEIQALSSVAALMGGNLVQAWHHFQQFSNKEGNNDSKANSSN